MSVVLHCRTEVRKSTLETCESTASTNALVKASPEAIAAVLALSACASGGGSVRDIWIVPLCHIMPQTVLKSRNAPLLRLISARLELCSWISVLNISVTAAASVFQDLI